MEPLKFIMAERQWECFRPGCDFKTEMMTAATGIEYLKLHSSEVHGLSSKPEKPKKPSLEMTGSCVDALEWEFTSLPPISSWQGCPRMQRHTC